MSAPKTTRGQHSRDHIVATAAEIMRTHGVEGTSIDVVLAAAGASKSQLYHYFSSRQGLIRSVIAYQAVNVVQAQSERLRTVDSWPSLQRWFDEIVEIQQAYEWRLGCPVGSLAAELADHNDEARGDLAAALNQWRDDIEAMLRRLQSNGALRRGAHCRSLAVATLAAIQGALLLSKLNRDPEPLRATLATIYSTLHGHRPQRSS